MLLFYTKLILYLGLVFQQQHNISFNEEPYIPDTIICKITEQRSGWIDEWVRLNKNFNPKLFVLKQKKNFDLKFQNNNYFDKTRLLEYNELLFYSPKKGYVIDIFSHHVSFIAEGGTKCALFDVDAKVYLIDLQNNKSQFILQSGSIEQFEDALWINNEAFIIIGTKEFIASSNKTKFKPYILIFDMKTREYSNFEYSGEFEKNIQHYFSNRYKIPICFQ